MIEIRGLTKRFGTTTAVDELSFTVRPGQVTGFLGPNGAGKSTTMRVLLGLARATAGSATVDGRRYADLPGMRPTSEEPVRQLREGAVRHPRVLDAVLAAVVAGACRSRSAARRHPVCWSPAPG